MYILLTYQKYQIINLFIGSPGFLLKPFEKIYVSDRASEFTYCAYNHVCIYFINS